MTVAELEDKLSSLGYKNLMFYFSGSDRVEAMVELEDGQMLGMTGSSLDEATEQLLSKLEELDKGEHGSANNS
jgi:hypothetical protein